MVYIKENIQIFETDLPKFVDNKFSEYFVNVDTSDSTRLRVVTEKLDKETHEKLVRYHKCLSILSKLEKIRRHAAYHFFE